jgi:hypothetical protein
LNEAVGKDLADAVESLVAGFDRNRGPVAVQTLVDAARDAGVTRVTRRLVKASS